MKKKRFLTIAMGFIFIFTVAIFMTGQGIVNAGDCRIVRLYGGSIEGGQSNIRIEPITTLVTPGTCVIWMNWSHAAKVKVAFAEGKGCLASTSAPTGFVLDANSCYATDHIPLGATVSLMFTVPGTYKFSAEVGGKSPALGTIVVRKDEKM